MKLLKNVKIGMGTRSDETHFILSLFMQDAVIQPPKKDLETSQLNMALALNTPMSDVAEGLRYFADQLDQLKAEQPKPKLIGI